MLFTKVLSVVALAAVSEALYVRDISPELQRRGTRVLKRQAANTCLEANAVQTGSQDDGQNPPVAGQKASATDAANFINFCSGQTLTNGLQVQGGSCNGIVMGKIPSTNNMISAIIISPKPGEDLAASQTFTLSVQLVGLDAGAFTNAQKTYYAAPQDLNGGKVVGHTHFTVQDLGNNLEPNNPPDPTKFVFFKGVNDAGNGNGLLSATVTGGLPAGNYRVCTMTSASNHQPVIMPVAQRGAQDDCQKFTVGAGTSGGAAAPATGGGTAPATGGGGAAAGGGGTAASSAAAAASSTTDAAVASSTDAAAASSTAAAGATTTSAAAQASATSAAGGGGTGAVGGIEAPPVVDSGNPNRPFSVNGNTFVNRAAAKQRACDIQNNACSDAVNGGRLRGFKISDCQAQQARCNAAP